MAVCGCCCRHILLFYFNSYVPFVPNIRLQEKFKGVLKRPSACGLRIISNVITYINSLYAAIILFPACRLGLWLLDLLWMLFFWERLGSMKPGLFTKARWIVSPTSGHLNFWWRCFSLVYSNLLGIPRLSEVVWHSTGSRCGLSSVRYSALILVIDIFTNELLCSRTTNCTIFGPFHLAN